jgi:hypothetical protein
MSFLRIKRSVTELIRRSKKVCHHGEFGPFKTDDSVFEAPRRSPTELTFVSQDWCGSEMEMAPGIVRSDFYSFGVDYWSCSRNSLCNGYWQSKSRLSVLEEEVALQIRR